MANVLLLGGGGREHAIAKALMRGYKEQEDIKPKIYAIMNRRNPGIDDLCHGWILKDERDPNYIDFVKGYAKKRGIKYAIIGPETLLRAGIANELENINVHTVGPLKEDARIEYDKAWERLLQKEHKIAGLPEFRVFRRGETDGMSKYIDELCNEKGDVVIKPSGLTGGKGVKVMGEHFGKKGAKAYARKVAKEDDLVIEERLIGEEATLQALVNDEDIAFCPWIQDHKRAFDGDMGLNTGGMGSYNDSEDILPFMTKSHDRTAKKIMNETVHAIYEETGVPYKWILYGQFMLGKKVSMIEFNARFGDPEAMNALYLLNNPLDVIEATANGNLSRQRVKFKKEATVFKYVVTDGYPKKPSKEAEIEIGNIDGAELFFANIIKRDGKHMIPSSPHGLRLCGVLGAGPSIPEAEECTEKNILRIKGKKIRHRADIGTQDIINRRIQHMKEL